MREYSFNYFGGNSRITPDKITPVKRFSAFQNNCNTNKHNYSVNTVGLRTTIMTQTKNNNDNDRNNDETMIMPILMKEQRQNNSSRI